MIVGFKWLMIFSTSYIPQVFTQGKLSLECKDNTCKIDNNSVIKVKAGTTLLLLISVPKSTFFAQLTFDSKPVVNIMSAKVTLDRKADIRFSLHDQTVSGGRMWYELSFKNTNLTRDNGKLFQYWLNIQGQIRDGNFSFYILDAPKFCGNPNMKKEFSIKENGDQTIPITLCGNPAPQVHAAIESKNLIVTMKKDALYQYSFHVSLKEVTRKDCGKSVILKVVNSTIKHSYKLKVLFIPDQVEDIFAYIDYKGCLTAEWKAVQSGNCPIKYELQYKDKGVSSIRIIDGLTWSVCKSHINSTINVRALYNGQYGEFNDQSILVSPPPSTTMSPNELKKIPPTTTSPLIEIIIAFSVIILIVLLIVIYSCYRRQRSQRDKMVEENHDVLMIPTPQNRSDQVVDSTAEEEDDNYLLPLRHPISPAITAVENDEADSGNQEIIDATLSLNNSDIQHITLNRPQTPVEKNKKVELNPLLINRPLVPIPTTEDDYAENYVFDSPDNPGPPVYEEIKDPLSEHMYEPVEGRGSCKAYETLDGHYETFDK